MDTWVRQTSRGQPECAHGVKNAGCLGISRSADCRHPLRSTLRCSTVSYMNSATDPLRYLTEDHTACALCHQVGVRVVLTTRSLNDMPRGRAASYRPRLRGYVLNHLVAQHRDLATREYPTFTAART